MYVARVSGMEIDNIIWCSFAQKTNIFSMNIYSLSATLEYEDV